MKHALQIALASVPIVLLTSCGNLTPPNSQSFDPNLDPLDSPGSRKKASGAAEAGPRFPPGSYVEVSDSNAGFYSRAPRGNQQADYRLAVGTPLKIVGQEGSYVKVETESGQIGYVPAIMVTNKAAVSNAPPVRAPTTTSPASAPQIDPVDPVDPSELEPLPPLPTPGSQDPAFVAPEPEVPPISVEDAPAPRGPEAP